jgi:hypothetical protein
MGEDDETKGIAWHTQSTGKPNRRNVNVSDVRLS